MWLSLDVGYWLTLLLAVPAAGFLVRLFIIQHDCGHGAFFRQRVANLWMGRVLGVFTMTPFDYWKRNHAIHYATSSISTAARHRRYRSADGGGVSQQVLAGTCSGIVAIAACR